MELITIILAGLMITMWLIPATSWHLPQYQKLETGFDPMINYVNTTRGAGTHEAQATYSQSEVQLASWGDSGHFLHLYTFSYRDDISSDFNFDILDNQAHSDPTTIEILDPRGQVSYFLNFSEGPSNTVTSQIVDHNKVTHQNVIGTYVRGNEYRVSLNRSIANGTISIALSGALEQPSEHDFIVLVGGPSSPSYYQVLSPLIPIIGGTSYSFGGTLRSLGWGNGCYKLVVDWFNQSGNKTSTSNDWRCSDSLRDWTQVQFVAIAPPDARIAQLRAGAGDGYTVVLMSDLFMKSTNKQTNLIQDPSITNNNGWSASGSVTTIDHLIAQPNFTMNDSLGAAETPSFFAAVPVSVALASSSEDGMANVLVRNLTVAVPNQRLMAITISDSRAVGLVLVLASSGSLVLGLRGLAFLQMRTLDRGKSQASFHIGKRSVLLISIFTIVGVVYLAANSLLFSLGAHYYDLFNSETWSYLGGRYGISSIYTRSDLAAIPSPVSSIPAGSSAFPYGPFMAYYFGAIGSVVNTIAPFAPSPDLQASQFAIKFANAVFGLASSFITYAILRARGFTIQKSLLGMSMLLLNPVLWFVDSIWGETHAFSIFLLLISVFCAQRGRLSLSWASAIASALTRPEMLAPSILLMAYLLFRHSSIRKAIPQLALGIIILFVALTPLMITYAPSLPVDVYAFSLSVQNGTDQISAKFLYNSLDSFNLWPIVTPFSSGASGPARYWTSSATVIVANLSYLSLSNYLFLALFGVLVVRTLLLKKGGLTGRWFGLLASGCLVLLMLRVGISIHQFALAIPLLILALRRGKDYVGYLAITLLTFTTLVGTWGSIPAALHSSSPLYPTVNSATRVFMLLYLSDWFITVAVALNVLVLVLSLARS